MIHGVSSDRLKVIMEEALKSASPFQKDKKHDDTP